MTAAVLRMALLLCVAWLWTPPPARAQTRPAPARPPSEAPPPTPPWQLQLTASGVLDSNIDHDREDLDAYGGLLGGRLRYTAGPLTLDYRLGVNRFNEPTRWNRLTNRAAARLVQPLAPAWTVDLLGEVSFQQRSEDQELGNFFVVAPRLEYRADGNRTIRGVMLYRLKQIQEDVDENATNWYAGAEFEQEAGDGQTWIFEYRRELNQAKDPRRTYAGHRLTAEYRRRFGGRDQVRTAVSYRPQAYRHRLVATDEGDVLRRDRRWLPEFAWLRTLSDQVTSRMDYSWERRWSNERAREFTAHRVSVSLVWSDVF